MSAPTEVRIAGDEQGFLEFDPTTPDAAHTAIVMTHALQDISHEIVVPDAAIETVDHARESALMVRITPSSIRSKAGNLQIRPEAKYESTIAPSAEAELAIASTPTTTMGIPPAKDPEALWKPTPAQELKDAKEPVIFDPVAVKVTMGALRRKARQHLTSLDPEVRAERKEAREVLAKVFGERYRFHEAASRVADIVGAAGRLVTTSAVFLSKLTQRR